MNNQILIIDLGSQYTLVIARVITALGVKCTVAKPKNVKNLEGVKGIILSGSNSSVYAENAPQVPKIIFESDIPILGICYGMQYMVFIENSKYVWASDGKREYGQIGIEINERISSPLFKDMNPVFMAWASHGDTVQDCPDYYEIIAKATSVSGIQAIQHKTKKWYGLQFHPEVDDTRDDNQILKNFIFRICFCSIDWNAKLSVDEIRMHVSSKVLSSENVLIAVSGGVDSTTLAAILSPMLGEKLHCVFIDHGGMRENEVVDIIETCRECGINLVVLKADLIFSTKINTTDAEEKRKQFKQAYLKLLKDYIKNNDINYIIQGTLATDLIESGHAGESVSIKSHHNVDLDFKIPELTPFAKFFKHEVRDIARELNLSFAERQPFPGPGLYIRIVGVVPTIQLISTLRQADYIVTEVLKEEDIYSEISQLVVGLFGIKTVGIQGDERSYRYPIVVRPFQTMDFMTGSGYRLPREVEDKISAAVISHNLTNRVIFGYTSKPPATTEFE